MWWPTPVIPVTWEMEIGRITVQGQPRQKVSITLSQQTSGYDDTLCNTMQAISIGKRITVQAGS
jgi:hypothetical protein